MNVLRMDCKRLLLIWPKVILFYSILAVNSVNHTLVFSNIFNFLKIFIFTFFTFFFLGIPSLGLLPTDPLRVSSLVIDQGVGAVKLKMQYKDLDIKNMQTTTVKELKYVTSRL